MSRSAGRLRLLVLGSGLMGPAAAGHAMAAPEVAQVVLADRDPRQLDLAAARIAAMPGAEKLATAVLDVAGPEAAGALSQFDAVVSALPQAASAPALRAAAAAQRPLVDLTWPPAAELPELDRRLAAAGTLVVCGCGVDPGLTEIIARHLADRLDRVEELHIRCGGIPEQPAPPLGYKIVFGGRQLPLREEEALVVEAGELRPVPRYSGVETFVVAGVGELEAYHEGFPPWLLELPALRGLLRGSTRTVRWPGYAARAALLRELGLLSLEPVEVDGARVAPKHLLDAVLAPRLRLAAGERDLTVLRVEAAGEKGGRRCRLRAAMLDRYDERTGLTSMARVTAFTAAIIARMAARGELAGQGLLPPERVVAGERFAHLVAELAAAGIRFELTAETTEPL